MKDIIETLCSIDTSASQIIESAAAQKSRLSKEYEDMQTMAQKQIQDETKERLGKLTRQLDAQNDAEIKRLKEEAKKNLIELDNNYRKNHEQYVREIFTRITGV